MSTKLSLHMQSSWHIKVMLSLTCVCVWIWTRWRHSKHNWQTSVQAPIVSRTRPNSWWKQFTRVPMGGTHSSSISPTSLTSLTVMRTIWIIPAPYILQKISHKSNTHYCNLSYSYIKKSPHMKCSYGKLSYIISRIKLCCMIQVCKTCVTCIACTFLTYTKTPKGEVQWARGRWETIWSHDARGFQGRRGGTQEVHWQGCD